MSVDLTCDTGIGDGHIENRPAEAKTDTRNSGFDRLVLFTLQKRHSRRLVMPKTLIRILRYGAAFKQSQIFPLF